MIRSYHSAFGEVIKRVNIAFIELGFNRDASIINYVELIITKLCFLNHVNLCLIVDTWVERHYLRVSILALRLHQQRHMKDDVFWHVSQVAYRAQDPTQEDLLVVIIQRYDMLLKIIPVLWIYLDERLEVTARDPSAVAYLLGLN